MKRKHKKVVIDVTQLAETLTYIALILAVGAVLIWWLSQPEFVINPALKM